MPGTEVEHKSSVVFLNSSPTPPNEEDNEGTAIRKIILKYVFSYDTHVHVA